jgi:hypothetical protein
MGTFAASGALRWLGWVASALMAVAVLAMLASSAGLIGP